MGWSLSSCKTGSATSSSSGKGPKELTDKERVEFEYAFYNAAKEKVMGNYDLAESLYAQALHINPSSGAAMYDLATIYSFQNNKNQALLYSKRAAAIEPKNVWYQLLYAECLKANKQPELVTGVFERLVKDNPDRIDFYYELANSYLYNNKASEAVKVYNKIEARAGVTEESSMQKLKIYKATNNLDKSIEEAQKLIKNFPKEPKYYGILGEIYQDKGMPEKALQAYNDLLAVDPTNAYVHLSLADYYRNQKQNEKAFEEIKIAFRSKDLDIDTKVKILLSYYSITETYTELKPDADELCRILVETHPDDAKSYSMYGDFLYRDKKLTLARENYRKAISLDKEKYALWNQLLIIESEMNDIPAMEKESKEAMEYFPNQSLPFFFNGSANMQLKNYAEAVKVFNEGKEFVYDNKPLLVQFYANLGDAYNQLKNNAASDSAYDKALELDPSSVYVLNNYAYYLSLRNSRLDKAESMSKKSNELEPNNSSYQDTYGWILYQMHHYEDAKIWIGKAVENGGTMNPTLLEHYGDVLFQLGKENEAVDYWIRAKNAGGASEYLNKKIADKKLYE